MIEGLSSNQFSSHLRPSTFSGEQVENQEKERITLPQVKEENNEVLPKEKVKNIVDSLNKFMESSPTALKFEFHEKLNEYYVKIIDEKTKETVREIPPKKMLDFYAAMTEFLGLILDRKI